MPTPTRHVALNAISALIARTAQLSKDLSESGRFAVREREGAPGEYVLSVNYKGKPTHHLCTTDGGVLKINKKDFGAGWSSIEEAIEKLSSSPPAGWPVKLATGCAFEASSSASSPAQSRQGSVR